MNRTRMHELVLAAVAAFWCSTALAVPPEVPYVGFLVDDQGPYDSDVSGPVAITVEVFDQETDGQLLWGPCEFGTVPVDNGVFAVVLDGVSCAGMDSTPLPLAGAWLQFTIVKDEVVTPLEGRQGVLSVPFALWTDSAETCDVAAGLATEEGGSVSVAGLALKNHDHDAQYVEEGESASIKSGMIAEDAVAGMCIQDGSVTMEHLGDSGCSNGQVFKWNSGTQSWFCANDLGGGGEEYTAGLGLLLGEDNAFSVDEALVKGWATDVCYATPQDLIEAAPLWDQNASDDLTQTTEFAGEVGGTYGNLIIAGGAVTGGKLGGNAVTSEKIKDGTVAFADIGQNDCQQDEAMRWTGSAWACTPVYSQDQANANFALLAALNEAVGRLDDAEANIEALQDTVSLQQDTINAQADTIAQLEAGECPAGYDKIEDGDIVATGYYCRKAVGGGKFDEMVKVGDYWIDRYEMSVWSSSDCTGTQYGGSDDNWKNEGATGTDHHHGFFPRNGNWETKLYACSVSEVMPSRWFTWFQAQAACQLQGKHLCTNGEWQGAAEGTPDPGAYPDTNDGDGCSQQAPITGKCNTCSSGPRSTGDGWYLNMQNSCMSLYGAFDMVGNLWEWVDMWGQAGRTKYDVDGSKFSQAGSAQPWASGYGDDGTWNVNGEAYNGSAYAFGLPASALRGGAWGYGAEAGVFALALNDGAAAWGSYIGARCCRRK